MKKLIITVIVTFIAITFLPAFSQAEPTVYGNDRKCLSSGLQTGDAAISARAANVCGIILIPDGTNACTLVLYNNPDDNSGTVLAKHTIAAGEAGTAGYLPPFEIPADIGIYADHTTCQGYIVYYH